MISARRLCLLILKRDYSRPIARTKILCCRLWSSKTAALMCYHGARYIWVLIRGTCALKQVSIANVLGQRCDCLARLHDQWIWVCVRFCFRKKTCDSWLDAVLCCSSLPQWSIIMWNEDEYDNEFKRAVMFQNKNGLAGNLISNKLHCNSIASTNKYACTIWRHVICSQSDAM